MSTDLLDTLKECDIVRMSTTGAFCCVLWSLVQSSSGTQVHVSELFSEDEYVLTDDIDISPGVWRGKKVKDGDV